MWPTGIVTFMLRYCHVGILIIFWFVKGTSASSTLSCVLWVGLCVHLLS